jgi:hypothetical protein
MRRIRNSLFLLIIIFFVCHISFGQKAKYHGDIIYHLTKHITWPEKSEGYKFIIGVVGNDEDFRAFQQLAVEKGEFQGHPIEVRYFECSEEVEECHMIYISEKCEVDVNRLIKRTKNDPILIISGEKGYGESGSVINFVDMDGKLKLELNQQQASKRGLQISDGLIDLAILI